MHSLFVAFLALAAPDVGSEPDLAAASTPARTVRLVSAAKEDRLRQMLPRVADSDLRKLLGDPRLIFYTEAEMPRTYQFWSGDLQGIHLASYNISADGGEPHGNGNKEFPWGHPAGTHRSKNVESFRFLWLPVDENGKTRPVVWHKKRLRGDSTPGYAWTFPVGTVFGEVLAMTGPDGLVYTFELRTRTREYGYWDVDVQRPFTSAAELARRIKDLRPNWQDQPKLAAAVAHLEQPIEMEPKRLKDSQPGKRTFDQTMGIDTLPSLGDDALVSELLTTAEFKSATGEVWRESGNGLKTYAPTTSAGFHIVPASYDAGFIQVDRSSCLRCHDSVNKPVSDFNAGRDWYGRIRGSDGIFSFHPFALESISNNGYGSGVRMRTELEQAGVIAKFDAARHSNEVYHAIEALLD